MKQNDSKATPPKRSIDVELALRWMARDELSKRATSTVESVWEISKHGGLSTLHDALRKAWAAVGDRCNPGYRQQRRRCHPRNRIEDIGRHGGIDVDDTNVSSQRYAHIGEPDPDALTLERAIAKLEPVVIDRGQSLVPMPGRSRASSP